MPNTALQEDNDDTILNTNIYRVMLGDKGFEPMNTVIIIRLYFELFGKQLESGKFQTALKFNKFANLFHFNIR